MTALQWPCTLFETKKRMDDYNAPDMQYGDLTQEQLKKDFLLTQVSERVDPFALKKITSFNRPQSMFFGSRNEADGETVSRSECARIMFDEFRSLSHTFAIYGPYRHLIGDMITHMQNANGAVFTNMSLDAALKDQILRDTTKNSTRLRIEKVLEDKINWEEKNYPLETKGELREAIAGGKLPKFDRFQDIFNGMSITVHDTWATQITLKALWIDNDRYHAVLHYKVQDHFGLDVLDISKIKFKQFHFFRIWFVLQRYNKFGFKPFMTNMEATIDIVGRRNESK
ncbi:YPO3983 family protein [Pseudomonas graminis]